MHQDMNVHQDITAQNKLAAFDRPGLHPLDPNRSPGGLANRLAVAFERATNDAKLVASYTAMIDATYGERLTA